MIYAFRKPAIHMIHAWSLIKEAEVSTIVIIKLFRRQIARLNKFLHVVRRVFSPGGGLPYETDGDARRLA